jgi:hypothetical protein
MQHDLEISTVDREAEMLHAAQQDFLLFLIMQSLEIGTAQVL